MSTPTPHLIRQQPSDALTVRDRLACLFGIVGVRTTRQVVNYGPNKAVALSPLWIEDAHKLTEALNKVPEPHGPVTEASR